MMIRHPFCRDIGIGISFSPAYFAVYTYTYGELKEFFGRFYEGSNMHVTALISDTLAPSFWDQRLHFDFSPSTILFLGGDFFIVLPIASTPVISGRNVGLLPEQLKTPIQNSNSKPSYSVDIDRTTNNIIFGKTRQRNFCQLKIGFSVWCKQFF